MSDLMLIGILRAPPPDTDNVLGVAQLVSAAKTAADEIERLERGRDIQKGNAERWEKLAIQYKREIERLENEIKAAIPHNQERLHEMNRLRDELKQANADRKKDCVDFFRWFWNAPGTNTEQGYDEWLAALETDDE